ncbi:glycosyltransferase family 4 protein [Candidatus Saccharibacteria bacterium]|nr:glycosyltransferase family 4 protein [Candidatus Saccharibacteria bacterium]
MKILMLGWELPPHHTGGMGVVCYQMCKELAQSGADIEFILPYTAEFPNIDFMTVNPALPEGVTEVIGSMAGSTYDSQYFTYVDNKGNSRGVQMHEHQSAYTQYVAKLARLNEYDVIHAHDWLTFRAALAAKQLTAKPLFVHVHATEFDRSGGSYGNPLVREIEHMGLLLADKIFAISQATKDTIVREYNIDPAKIEIVHNAMELEESELHEDTSVNTFTYLQIMQGRGYKVILSAGRLTIQKGLIHLLEAFAKVVEKRPKTILLVVGSGEQYTELIEHSAVLGLSGNVIFTGRINGTGKTWRDAFRVANLFVMPSVSEPFGLTPFEALLQHTPALISKQSGASELLRNVLKLDYWDIEEMSNQILAVCNNSDLEITLAEEGSAELANITWKRSVQKMMHHYQLHAHKQKVLHV